MDGQLGDRKRRRRFSIQPAGSTEGSDGVERARTAFWATLAGAARTPKKAAAEVAEPVTERGNPYIDRELLQRVVQSVVNDRRRVWRVWRAGAWVRYAERLREEWRKSQRWEAYGRDARYATALSVVEVGLNAADTVIGSDPLDGIPWPLFHQRFSHGMPAEQVALHVLPVEMPEEQVSATDAAASDQNHTDGQQAVLATPHPSAPLPHRHASSGLYQTLLETSRRKARSEWSGVPPTELEEIAREMATQRMRQHEERNRARQLTPEARRAKWHARLRQERQRDRVVSVFRVEAVDPQRAWTQRRRFRLREAVRRWQAGGLAVARRLEPPDASPLAVVMVIESGARAARHLQRLLSERLQWGEDGAAGVLVWHGRWLHAQLPETWVECVCDTERQVRRRFATACAEELYDIARGSCWEEAGAPEAVPASSR
ncbi:hypothetical protein CDCA_CDCA01G0398 [Cyanidium caldarium]|uniref:Uncharacterized protein n=1 Tax=Cyanidium caldarium TaxID=2771 RepID=A0AAV9IQ62_CYACA|nr:hypothetical protein CDCA_CDCA01G0398 [Cyanidium caldarium]